MCRALRASIASIRVGCARELKPLCKIAAAPSTNSATITTITSQIMLPRDIFPTAVLLPSDEYLRPKLEAQSSRSGASTQIALGGDCRQPRNFCYHEP